MTTNSVLNSNIIVIGITEGGAIALLIDKKDYRQKDDMKVKCVTFHFDNNQSNFHEALARATTFNAFDIIESVSKNEGVLKIVSQRLTNEQAQKINDFLK
jgi:hypothetical protein